MFQRNPKLKICYARTSQYMQLFEKLKTFCYKCARCDKQRQCLHNTHYENVYITVSSTRDIIMIRVNAFTYK